MRRFELRDGEVDKFWEIERQGAVVRSAWGKPGSSRFSREQSYASDAEAKSAFSEAVHQRRVAGWVSARGADSRAGTAENRKLLAAIEADPSDPDAYAIYADWLQTREDPRGELMSLHLAARGSSARATAAREKAAELIAKHDEHFYGKAAHVVGEQLQPEWGFGFLHAIDWYNDEGGDSEDSLEILIALLDHPSSKLLRQLSILMNDFAQTLWASLLPRLAARHLTQLRLTALDAGSLGPLLSSTKLPSLTHLTLVAVTGDFIPKLARSRLLRQLRELELHDAFESDDAAESLLEHAKRFEHLDAIRIARGSVTPKMLRRLAEALPIAREARKRSS